MSVPSVIAGVSSRGVVLFGKEIPIVALAVGAAALGGAGFFVYRKVAKK